MKFCSNPICEWESACCFRRPGQRKLTHLCHQCRTAYNMGLRDGQHHSRQLITQAARNGRALSKSQIVNRKS